MLWAVAVAAAMSAVCRLENNRRCLIGSGAAAARRRDPVRLCLVHLRAHRPAAVPRHAASQVRARGARPPHQRVARRQTDLLRQQGYLDYLLPPKRDTSVTSRLRAASPYPRPTLRTIYKLRS